MKDYILTIRSTLQPIPDFEPQKTPKTTAYTDKRLKHSQWEETVRTSPFLQQTLILQRQSDQGWRTCTNVHRAARIEPTLDPDLPDRTRIPFLKRIEFILSSLNPRRRMKKMTTSAPCLSVGTCHRHSCLYP